MFSSVFFVNSVVNRFCFLALYQLFTAFKRMNSGLLAVIATVSDVIEVRLSDIPDKDLIIEIVAAITGAKNVEAVAGIAKELSSKKAEGIIHVASEAPQLLILVDSLNELINTRFSNVYSSGNADNANA